VKKEECPTIGSADGVAPPSCDLRVLIYHSIGVSEMSAQVEPKFEGGKNIAMKLPRHLFEKTVAFYGDVLRLRILEEEDTSVAVEFGALHLWLDRVDHLNQAEIWLEIVTDNVERAADYLDSKSTVRRDDVEPLPEGFEGFWICNPADVIHLVARHGK
jgi:hypothetical protein